MASALAPHVRELRVVSPLAPKHGPRSPLNHLGSLRRLRALRLCHVAFPALEQALLPAALTALHVTVNWENARKGWLDFARHLTGLQVGSPAGPRCTGGVRAVGLWVWRVTVPTRHRHTASVGARPNQSLVSCTPGCLPPLLPQRQWDV